MPGASALADIDISFQGLAERPDAAQRRARMIDLTPADPAKRPTKL
jgi:hypothetical protein